MSPQGTAALTICTIARDEDENLRQLLPSLRWADELLVLVDAETRDDSRRVAQQHADRVETLPFVSFSAFRNAALRMAIGRWILFVDADERVSDALVQEVRSAVGQGSASSAPAADPAAGYWIPRYNLIFGRLVRGGGWFPDYQLRLLSRKRTHYDEARMVHELAMVDGPLGYLSEPLLHFNYRSPKQFIAKQRRYLELEVAALRQAGQTPRRRALLGQPAREFWHRYGELGGWRDGPVGLFLAGALAYYAYRRVALVLRESGRAS